MGKIDRGRTDARPGRFKKILVGSLSVIGRVRCDVAGALVHDNRRSRDRRHACGLGGSCRSAARYGSVHFLGVLRGVSGRRFSICRDEARGERGKLAGQNGQGTFSPEVCHPTADYLLSLDENGPSGRFFWLGYEVPLFPDLVGVDWLKGKANEKLRKVLG